MGKISELDMAIRDLRTAASTINDVADTLAEMFSSKEDENSAPVEQAENADKQTLTFDQVSNALMAISRMSKEHSKKLRALVQKYGASKLSEIAPEHYEAILAEAEVIGNAG